MNVGSQSERDRRREKRVRLSLGIRVLAFDEARGRFIEDTQTILVSPSGSLIGLKHQIFPADTIRIINLENMEEADFRVVGPSIVSETEVAEWGVECTHLGRSIWGAQYNEVLRSEGQQLEVELECKACHQKTVRLTSLLEMEVLEATGMVAFECSVCRKATYWTYADAGRRPKAFTTAEAVAPPPRVVPIRHKVERRSRKRVRLKMPAQVLNARGEQEICNTEDMSKDGAAIALAMELSEGDVVRIFYPYIPDGTNIEQKAVVRWKDPHPSDGRRYYGFRFVR
jgi:transcription elongation factor Elf1